MALAVSGVFCLRKDILLKYGAQELRAITN